MGLPGHCILDEQSLKRIDAQPTRTALNLFEDCGEHFLAFFDRKERCFFRIHQNGDDNLIKELAASLNDVEVAVGHRVERAWIDGASHESIARTYCFILTLSASDVSITFDKRGELRRLAAT